MYKIGQVTASVLNVREEPNINSFIVQQIRIGEIVAIVNESNSFLQIGVNKWVHSDWVKDYTPSVPTPNASGNIIDPMIGLSFLEVESNNYAFEGEFLVIRFEVHRFQAFLNNNTLFNRHFYYVGRNYGQQFWRRSPNDQWINAHRSQRERHELLSFARSLNNTAALQATGMGLGQIMGHNHRRIGYNSPQQMFNAFKDLRYGRNNQVIGFMNYILSDRNLHNALTTGNFTRAVQLYNGLGQEHIYVPALNAALNRFRELF